MLICINFLSYFLRDIKPENFLMFNSKKLLKIADMGLARESTMISQTMGAGTPVYIAPGNFLHTMKTIGNILMQLSLMLFLTCMLTVEHSCRLLFNIKTLFPFFEVIFFRGNGQLLHYTN